MHSARREDGEGHRGAFGPSSGPRKQPVLTTDRHAPKLALDNPVVVLESAVTRVKSRQHFPDSHAQVRRPFSERRRRREPGMQLLGSRSELPQTAALGLVGACDSFERRRRAPRPCTRARRRRSACTGSSRSRPGHRPRRAQPSNLRRECMWHPRRTMAPSDASAIVSKPAYLRRSAGTPRSRRASRRGRPRSSPSYRSTKRSFDSHATIAHVCVPALDTRRMVAVEHGHARVVDIHIRRGEHPPG